MSEGGSGRIRIYDRGEDPQRKKCNAPDAVVPPTTTSQIARDFELFQGHPHTLVSRAHTSSISPGLPTPSAITVSQEAEMNNDSGVYVKGGRDGPLTHCRCACCAHMSSECMGLIQTWKQHSMNYKAIEQFVLQQ